MAHQFGSTMKSIFVVAVVSWHASAVHDFSRRQDSQDEPPSPWQPPNNTVTVYHLFEPKYTGLANKDGGDFLGDASFIFLTFNAFEADNPEADIQDNIIEMSTVTVEGWSRDYLQCNAPGAVYKTGGGAFMNCPNTSALYCCVGNHSEITADSLPAYEFGLAVSLPGGDRGDGYWYAFPAASQGRTWNETVNRRIRGSCIANAWREEAGGCPECGANLDQCVALCIKSALTSTYNTTAWNTTLVRTNYSRLRPAWDKAFNDKTFCPDEPFPSASDVLII